MSRTEALLLNAEIASVLSSMRQNAKWALVPKQYTVCHFNDRSRMRLHLGLIRICVPCKSQTDLSTVRSIKTMTRSETIHCLRISGNCVAGFSDGRVGFTSDTFTTLITTVRPMVPAVFRWFACPAASLVSVIVDGIRSAYVRLACSCRLPLRAPTRVHAALITMFQTVVSAVFLSGCMCMTESGV